MIATTRAGNAGRERIKTNNPIIPKYPAYGKQLADRLRFKNPPKLVIINVGGDAWTRAKKWQQHPDFAALALTPENIPNRLIWPVSDCPCLVEWGIAAPEALIIELVRCLLKSGAAFVSVMPLFVDWSTPSQYFDTVTQTWQQSRESVRTYYARKEVNNVA